MRKGFGYVRQRLSVDSVFRNSLYLMLSTATMAVLGLVFWTVASHLLSTTQVGIGASLISAASLIAAASTLGFNNVLLRFHSITKERSLQVSSFLIVSSIAAIVVSAAFIAWVHSRPQWGFPSGSLPLVVGFVVLCVASTTNGLIDSVFIANRDAKYVLLKNSALSVCKPLLLIATSALGTTALIASSATALLGATVLGLAWFASAFGYRLRLAVSVAVVRRTLRFSVGSYAGNILGTLPATLIPLIVVSRLGPVEAAYLYMPMMVVALMAVVPLATAQSLSAEVASEGESSLRRHLFPAASRMYLLMLLVTALVCLFAPYFLRVFGATYAANGTTALRILALGALLGAGNFLGDAILNIRRQVGLYTAMSAINSLLVLGLVFQLAPRGLNAVALGFLLGQAMTLVLYVPLARRMVGPATDSDIGSAARPGPPGTDS